MNKKFQYYKAKLNLQPHPEGGYFREVYRSDEILKKESLPNRFDGDRNFLTAIYFLLEGEQTSKFHLLKSDEQWHFYDGCPVKIYILNENGELSVTTLGDNISNGEVFQTVIKRNNWFAAELIDKNSFCLVGCVVSPGFNFNDFELANRDDLITTYPQHKGLVIRFTS
jgi:uncharacterized protein